MSIEMEIVFDEKIDPNKLDELIDELNDETMNIDENLGEMRTFTDVGQALGDPLQQILIAVVASILANYIERKSPEAKEYTKKMLKNTYAKVKKLTNRSKIVIKKKGKDPLPLELGTEEEIEKTVETLASS